MLIIPGSKTSRCDSSNCFLLPFPTKNSLLSALKLPPNNGKNTVRPLPIVLIASPTSRSANLDSLDKLKQLSRMDRKAELERKKAKLQALREEKDRRRREKEQKDIEDAKAGITAPEKDQRK